MTEDQIAALCGGKKAAKRIAMRRTVKPTTDQIVESIGRLFATFGGNSPPDRSNPIAIALADRQLMFAAGVDVRKVVEFIRAELEK